MPKEIYILLGLMMAIVWEIRTIFRSMILGAGLILVALTPPFTAFSVLPFILVWGEYGNTGLAIFTLIIWILSSLFCWFLLKENEWSSIRDKEDDGELTVLEVTAYAMTIIILLFIFREHLPVKIFP